MSNTSTNVPSTIKDNKNDDDIETSEQTSYDSIQKKNTTKAKLSESKTKITLKYYKGAWIIDDDVIAPSTVSKDIIVNIEDETIGYISNRKSKWFNYPQILFKKFCRRSLKETHHIPQQKIYLNQERKVKTWAQFSLGNWLWDWDDDDEDYELLEYDPESRNTFVQMVLTLVGGMLLITGLFLLFVYNIPPLFKTFNQPSSFLTIFAIGGLLVVYFIMLCMKFGRKEPWSYYILGCTVLFAGFIGAIVTCRYKTLIVIYSFLTASVIVGLCIGLAFTKFDFTSFWLYLVVICLGMAILSMIIMFGMLITNVYIKPLHISILIISVALHSLALVMELQMILGGKSVQISENDHALAAFMLYTSIIDVFVRALQICGLSNS